MVDESSPKLIVGATTVIFFLSLLGTVFRLYQRVSRRVWAWDDAWLAIAGIFQLFSYVTALLVVHSDNTGVSIVTSIFTKAGPLYLSGSLWLARMSVGVTILRMWCEGIRRAAKVGVVAFGVMGTCIMTMSVVLCESENGALPLLCKVPPCIGYFKLAGDVFSGWWLVYAPYHLLYKLALPHPTHPFIMAIFSCNILPSIMGVVHSSFVLSEAAGTTILLSEHVQVGLAIFVANCLVIGPYLKPTQEDDPKCPVVGAGVVGAGPFTGHGQVSLITFAPFSNDVVPARTNVSVESGSDRDHLHVHPNTTEFCPPATAI